jgi:hypothetical protein
MLPAPDIRKGVLSKQQPVQHTQQAVACGRLGQAGDETDFARQPDIARQRVSADGNDWRADELRIVAYQPERFVRIFFAKIEVEHDCIESLVGGDLEADTRRRWTATRSRSIRCAKRRCMLRILAELSLMQRI